MAKNIKNIPCKCFAPATVANVAVGYDVLGFAIEGIGDEIVVNKGTEKGLKIKSIYGMRGLTKDIQKNTAGFAAYKLLESLGLEDEPIEMDLFKNMPIGTGMGSSAASAVAGAFGVNEYLGMPCSEKEVLAFATQAEVLADGSYHADNVAPSLMGGFVLIRDNPTLDVIRLPFIDGLRAVVIYPHIKILTKDSRDVLSDKVTLRQHIDQAGNLAAFVAAMYTSDLALLRRCLMDLIIEPQRAHLIPHFYDLKEMAMEEGAIGFSISGAGPSMFALCDNTHIAENIEQKAQQLFSDNKIEVTCYNSKININGAIRY